MCTCLDVYFSSVLVGQEREERRGEREREQDEAEGARTSRRRVEALGAFDNFPNFLHTSRMRINDLSRSTGREKWKKSVAWIRGFK